jgi:TnpA family transposase
VIHILKLSGSKAAIRIVYSLIRCLPPKFPKRLYDVAEKTLNAMNRAVRVLFLSKFISAIALTHRIQNAD